MNVTPQIAKSRCVNVNNTVEEHAVSKFVTTDDTSDPDILAEFERQVDFARHFRTVLSKWCTASYVWPVDPLLHWSRVWEYPFVATRLRASVSTGARVLDIGSATTFFPFYLANTLDLEVTALDPDPHHAKHFAACRAAAARALSLKRLPQPLQRRGDDTGCPDVHFDAVYCLSVIEHIHDPAPVIDEIDRVLRPGGIVVLTIDVAARDGDCSEGLDLPALDRLLGQCRARFGAPEICARPANVLTDCSPRHHWPDESRPLIVRLRPLRTLPSRLVRKAYTIVGHTGSGDSNQKWNPNICVHAVALRKSAAEALI